jgi:predicted ATPase
MFSEFRISNFKSYQESSLPLAPLTLLVGANASGKSNALEAIRFLSWLSQGRRLDDVLRIVQEEDITIRGTLDTLGYHASDIFALGCSLTSTGEWRHFDVKMKVDDRDVYILDERITSDESTVPLYEVTSEASQYSGEVQVAYNNFARGGVKPRIPCTNRRAIFTQLEAPSRFKQKQSQEVIPSVTEKLRTALQQILFLDPNPHQMRDYSFTTETELLGDGRNLSGVLYHLCEREQFKGQVLDFIRALPEQDIRDIHFLDTPRGEVMVQLTESFGNKFNEWDAPMLSDGTLRVLAVAAAVLSAPEGSMIAIEEIDNGVHPSRAGMLLDNVQRIAKERNLRVLVTSHNPALLDSLPNEAIPNVVCCYRDPAEGDSRLVRLEDLEEYPGLVSRGPLGQLMTKGILDRFVKDRRSAEQKKRQAQKWLRSFQQELELVEE